MWNKIKKVLSFGIVVLLVIAATVSGTLAYQMTADEFAAEEGHHIEVQLLRQQSNGDGVYVEQTEDPMLFPTANGYTENILCVKNNGNINTFNRVLVAVPARLDGAVELIKGSGWSLTKTLLDQSCPEESCNIYIFTGNGSLKPEAVSEPAVMGVRLDAALEQSGDLYLLNGVTYDFSQGLRLKVVAQSVQSAFFETPAHAFEKSGLAENPWQPAVTKEGPVSDAALRGALRSLPTGTDLTQQVTQVVFGYRAQYENITRSCYGRPVDEADPNGPWAYYQATADADGNTGWTVYILSWNVIYLPENCDNLFMDMSNLVSVDTTACDTRYVTSMHGMFQNCGNLTSVDVSNWDTSKVTTTWQMFQNCGQVTSLDLTGWNTEKMSNTANMFFNCSSLTQLDLTSFDMKNVTKAVNMFNGCRNLKTVYVSAEGGWDALSDRMADTTMFASCNRLVGGAGTTYSSQYGDYARIDGGSDAPGYFTAK